MEAIVRCLRLVRGVQGFPLAYVVRQHIKVAHILSGYDTYLNLDEEMVASAPIVDAKLNLKQIQDLSSKQFFSHDQMARQTAEAENCTSHYDSDNKG